MFVGATVLTANRFKFTAPSTGKAPLTPFPPLGAVKLTDRPQPDITPGMEAASVTVPFTFVGLAYT